MNENQKENFNLQIRKLLKQFGVKAHQLIKQRFDNDLSMCEISIKLEVDGKTVEELKGSVSID